MTGWLTILAGLIAGALLLWLVQLVVSMFCMVDFHDPASEEEDL